MRGSLAVWLHVGERCLFAGECVHHYFDGIREKDIGCKLERVGDGNRFKLLLFVVWFFVGQSMPALATLMFVLPVFFYQPGGSWTNRDCSRHCTCVDGQAECQDFQCGDNEECEVKNGVPSCYCQDGFVPLGDRCVRGESVAKWCSLPRLMF